jgi:hypothetical protein
VPTPALLYGNLLPLSAQSMESGVGDWVASHATIASSGTQFYDGSLSMQITSTVASGAYGANTNLNWTVTALAWYVFAYWIWCPVATSCNSELDWYNGGTYESYADLTGAYISVPAATWTQVAITAQCPSGSNAVNPIIIPQSTSNGVVSYADQAYLGPAPLPQRAGAAAQAVRRASLW